LHDYILSVILGIIEGLTEFIPVSSTAHLRIAERLMNISLTDPYWKMYTVVIQLGAIAVLPIYFWKRILKFISTFPKGERGDRTIYTHPLSLVMIAFVVTAIPALALTHKIGENLENLTVIALAMLIGGMIMWAVDVMVEYPTTHHMEDMTLKQAVVIGACQIFSAIFPGTSRSMSTIASGQVMGMDRPSALEFSFFLSMPTMFAATLSQLKKAIMKPKIPDPTWQPLHPLTHHDWIVLAIGMVVSFIVAFGSVAWFMNWVRKGGFVPFAIYRIIVGLALLVLADKLTGGAAKEAATTLATQ
jgi:undecaprenyl-diphosphatase